MMIQEKLQQAKQLTTLLPYQKTKDSPTIKYYTKWNKYLKHLEQEPIPHEKPDIKYQGILPKDTPRIILQTPTNIMLENNHENTITRIIDPSQAMEKEILSLYDPHEGKIMATHLSKIEKILYIRVPREEKVKRKIIFIPPEKGHYPYHITIVLEEKSELTIEFIQSEKTGSGLNTITIEIIQEKDSKLNVLNQLLPQKNTPLYYTMRIENRDYSNTRVNTLAKAGEMTHSRIEVIARGKNADTILKSVLLAEEYTVIDHITVSVNDAENTSAEIRVKGFNLGGELVHQGTVKATVKGKASINRLYSMILPLSEKGVSVSVPKLEVDTDNVKEGVHSSDISSLTQESLFYLQSRGLSREEALMLILQSSILDLLEYAKELSYDCLERYAAEIATDFIRR